MKTEIYINPKFRHMKDFIKGIPQEFDLVGQDVKSGKIDLKLLSNDGHLMAIKRINRVSPAHRILFSTICRSKARRAYDHSALLAVKGFSSPRPVACIDVYSKGLWRTGFYISLFTDSRPIKDLFLLPLAQAEEGLKSFARFTYRLHRAGIFHGDYTLNNVLYTFNGIDYEFSLIDNDIIRFGRYTKRRGLRNLRRLRLPADKLGIIGAEYARVSGASDLITLNAIIFFRLGHLFRTTVRKWTLKKIVQRWKSPDSDASR